MMPMLATRLFNTPLMIDEGKALIIVGALGDRILGRAPRSRQSEVSSAGDYLGTVGDELGRTYDALKVPLYDVIDGIAIIPIEGTLIHKGAWVGAQSGSTTYQGLQAQVTRAMNDDAVKAVAFEIDSHGGEVSGAFETSDMIFALSQAKPTMAILSDCAYSCGYLMASACRQITIPERGGAGSIGVISIHVDMSRALEADGLKVTLIAAGAHKADGNPYQSLPDEVLQRLMAENEATRQVFAGRVGAYRAGRFSADQALATEALAYRGVDAVTAGLCDGVGHPSEAFEHFKAAVNRA